MRAIPTVVALSLIMPASVLSVPAWAANVKSEITITKASGMKGGGVRVRGAVTSKESKCVKKRKVKVYHDVAPEGPSSADFLLGTVFTNAKGKWRVETPFKPDKVYARVAKKQAGKDKCKAAKSATVAVK